MSHPWGETDGKYAYVTGTYSNSLAVLDVSRFDYGGYGDLQQPRVRAAGTAAGGARTYVRERRHCYQQQQSHHRHLRLPNHHH